VTSNFVASSFQSISLFFEAFERIFHKALSFEASHSTWTSAIVRQLLGKHTDNGSTKSPRANGSLIKTV